MLHNIPLFSALILPVSWVLAALLTHYRLSDRVVPDLLDEQWTISPSLVVCSSYSSLSPCFLQALHFY